MKTLIIRWMDLNNSNNDCYQVVSVKSGLFMQTCNFMNRNAEILNLDLQTDFVTLKTMLVVRYRFRKGSRWTYSED